MNTPGEKEIDVLNSIIYKRLKEIFRNTIALSVIIYLVLLIMFTNMTIMSSDIPPLFASFLSLLFLTGIGILYFIIMSEMFYYYNNGMLEKYNCDELKSRKHSIGIFISTVFLSVILLFFYVSTEAKGVLLVIGIYLLYLLFCRYIKTYYTIDY